MKNTSKHPLTKEVGLKFDSGKPRITLLPFNALTEIAKVLTFGAEKYGKDNWKLVPKEKYGDALMRHLFSYFSGEKKDAETGLSHLAHAGCNILFLLYHELTRGKK